jgi:predicted RNA-binding protein Jag
MFLQQLQPNTAIDVLKSQSPSLVKIINDLKEDGVTAARALLVILLNDLVGFFNIGKTMSDVQIASTADLILEDFKLLKPDDFVLCFKRAKKGYYGKVYDRLDGQVIIEWLSQYECERNAEIEQFRAKEKRELEKGLSNQNDEKAIPMPDYVKELIKNISKKEPQTIQSNLSEQEIQERKVISRWDNQFNNFYKKFGFSSG